MYVQIFYMSERTISGYTRAALSYENGIVGLCDCGRFAALQCGRCSSSLCDEHARVLPATPLGVSANAAGRYAVAIRTGGEPHCEDCRADLGSAALADALIAPRAPLPDHWLDRAIALADDDSRSAQEKLYDAALPDSLAPARVVEEFLRRMQRPPRERVPVTRPRLLRAPRYASGWSVDCRRTEYTASTGDRYPLPCLIAVDGRLLGPPLRDGDRQGAAWRAVPDRDVDLPRLVTGAARLLVLSSVPAAAR